LRVKAGRFIRSLLLFLVFASTLLYLTANINFLNEDPIVTTSSVGLQFDLDNDGNNEILFSTNQHVGLGPHLRHTLDVTGSMGLGYQTVTADTTLSANSLVIADTDTAGTNLTLTLPSPSTVTGRKYLIKNLGTTYSMTIIGNMDDETSLALSASAYGSSIELISDGSLYHILGLAGNTLNLNGLTITSINAFDELSVAGVTTNDNLQIVFSDNTNIPEVSSKTLVDALIDFQGKVLGSNYAGYWNRSGNQLTITVLSPAGNTIAVGDNISIKAGGGLNFADNSGAVCTDTGTISGNFGTPLGGGATSDPTLGADVYLNAGDDDGVDTTWDATIGTWEPVYNGTVTWGAAGSSLPGISSAYDLLGGATGGAHGFDGTSLQDLGGGIDGDPISIEIWFKPDTTAGHPANGQILYETGGGTGIGIFWNGTSVETAHDSNANQISFDATGLTGEFIQVVITYNTTNGAGDDFYLYVNGIERASAGYDDGDMCGGDGAGLGTRGEANCGGAGGGDSSTESFDGKLAIVRFYYNQILTATEVLDNYNSIASAGSAEIDNSRNYPLISSITAADKAYDVGIGNSDNLTFVFSGNTNKPSVSNKTEIDNLIYFYGANVLGAAYSGVWSSQGNILIVTVNDKTGATVTVGQGANILASGELKFAVDPGNNSTATGVIVGSFEGDVFWDADEITSITELWYDADDADTLTLSGSQVNQWNDKSGNDRHVSQSTGSFQPDLVSTWSNGKNTVYWDPNDHINKRLTASGLANPLPDGDRHHFAVISPRMSNDNAFAGYVFGTNGNGGEERLKAAGRNATDPSITYSVSGFGGTVLTTETEQLVSWELDEGVRGRVFKDGEVIITDNSVTDIDLEAATFSIGGRFGGNDNFTAHLGEFITISDISKTTRIRIEGYLAHKWGIEGSLPDSHLYKNHAPRVTPIMVSLLANDFDESSHLVDVNDTITATFDGITNIPAVGTKADVDALLDFGSNVLGADYAGFWNGTGNVLTLTILDATGSTATVGMDISIRSSGNLFYSGNAIPSSHTASVTGDFGLDLTQHWNPGKMTTSMWLDARDVDSLLAGSSDNVYQWNDKSGNSNHAVQGSASAQPTSGANTLNTYNAVDFDGGDYVVDANFPSPSSGNLMAFAVATVRTVDNASDSIFSLDSASNNWQLQSNHGSQFNGSLNVVGMDGSTTFSGGPFSGTNIYGAVFDINGSYNGWVDGTKRSSDVAYSTKFDTPQSLKIMTNRSATDSLTGSVAEVIFTDNVQTLERLKIEGYLAHKWGLEESLPSTHWYRHNRPMIFPVIVSAVADDPTNMTVGPGTGDNVVLTFDGDTNTPAVGTKAQIDTLISFGSNTLGQDYSGTWNSDGNILVITIDNSTGANLTVGQTLTILSGGNLTFAGNITPSTANLNLTGDFGDSLGGNLFLWWPLDETSGNTANDSTANNRDGDLTDELYFSGNSFAAPHSTGLRLNKVAHTVRTLQTPISSDGYTWALWANYNWSTNVTVRTDPAVSGSSGYIWASNNLKYHKSAYHKLSNGTYISTSIPSDLQADTWYHLAGTYNGANLTLYLNGVAQSSNTATTWAGAANVKLANPITKAISKASADEVRIFDRALSSTEVLALYHAGDAPELWTPAEITTTAWYDASDNTTITTVGSVVSRWDDKSGSGSNISQSSGGARPSQSTINGRNAINSFQGDYLETTSLSYTLTTGALAIGVQRWDDGNYADMWNVSNTANSDLLNMRGDVSGPSDALTCVSKVDGGQDNFTTSAMDIHINFIGCLTWDTSNSYLYIDGQQTNTAASGAGPFTVNDLRVGYVSNSNLDSSVGELIILEDASTVTRQKLEGYLAWKWSLEANLPSGHPYKSAPPYK